MNSPAIAVFMLLASYAPVHVAAGEALDLSGSSWRLVKFESVDGTTVVPSDKSKYTLAFGANGRVAVRIDCNRGFASWSVGERNEISLGLLALTRAACPPHPLTDRIPRDWESIRKFVVSADGLSLFTADRGAYEFEPIPK